tara:strand:+ start:186 stop:407 length:222 start_codon:yes stop_codon:yes gene_type:complete
MKECEHTKGMTDEERRAYVHGFLHMEAIMWEVVLAGTKVTPDYTVPVCVEERKKQLRELMGDVFLTPNRNSRY